MPIGMPLHTQRGDFLTATEQFVASRADLITARAALLAGTDVATVANSVGLVQVPQTVEALLRNLWFESADPAGFVHKPFDEASNPTTGFWSLYHGKVHDIVCSTLVHAIDVALRNPTGATPDPHGPDPLPMLFLWSCPGHYFGGYVSWTEKAVVVVFHTPGNGDAIHTDFTDNAPDPTAAGGFTVVTHAKHRWWLGSGSIAATSGVGLRPRFGVRGLGGVVRQGRSGVDGGTGP